EPLPCLQRGDEVLQRCFAAVRGEGDVDDVEASAGQLCRRREVLPRSIGGRLIRDRHGDRELLHDRPGLLRQVIQRGDVRRYVWQLGDDAVRFFELTSDLIDALKV